MGNRLQIGSMKLLAFIKNRKYELLLFGLLQHLFIGIFLTDLVYYKEVIWVVNMLILGIVSIGVFIEKGRWKKMFRNFLLLLVIIVPISFSYFQDTAYFLQIMSLVYVSFFALIFFEVVKFLIRPSYINTDIISAALCGYLLLIEISVFLLLFLLTNNPDGINNVDVTNIATIYVDLVYLSTVIHTSIGFGDIVPTAPNVKLAVSLLGIIGQFYSVVLIGIIISKFSSAKK